MRNANLFLLLMAIFSSGIGLSGEKIAGHTIISKPLTALQQIREARKIKHDLRDIEKLKFRMDETIKNIVTFTTTNLRNLEVKTIDKGFEKSDGYPYRELADYLYNDYMTNFQGFLSVNKALGDHEPLTEYMDVLYLTLVELIGDDLAALWRIEDINILNYAIPIVMNADLAFDKGDYSLHFVPLSKVLTWWGTMAICYGISYGAGIVIPFTCRVPASVLEGFIGTFVAPVASDFVYCRSVPEGVGCDMRVRKRIFRRKG